ncbi:MAG: alpha-E domain-containing protein [bacterium]
MIARIADHLCWLGRYVERADATARLLIVTRTLALDADLSAEELWLPVLVAAGEDAPYLARFPGPVDGDQVETYLTWDCGVSLLSSVRAARENAWSVRSTSSLEVWQAINELHLWLEADGRKLFERSRHDFYRRVQRFAQLIFGLTQSTMLHDQALDLLWLGVLLERAGQVARAIDVHHLALFEAPDPAVGAMMWLGVLRVCSAYEPFARRRPGQATGPNVAEFLLLEADFPRSIRFSLTEAHAALTRIAPPGSPAGQRAGAHLRRLCDWLDAIQRDTLATDLHGILTHVVDDTARLGSLLWDDLFSGRAGA